MLSAWFDAEERYVAAWHRGELDWNGQRRARIKEMSDKAGRPLTDLPAIDHSFEHYLQRYKDAWRPFEDVHDALGDLRTRGLRIAILTNGQDEQQRQKIAAIGIDPFLVDVLSSDRIGFAKPDPRAFLTACDTLRTRPDEVLHVGDRYELDVLAPRIVGIDSVYLDRNDRGPTAEPARIARLTDLPRFL